MVLQSIDRDRGALTNQGRQTVTSTAQVWAGRAAGVQRFALSCLSS